MDLWHLTFASDGRLPLFDGERPRRAAVQAIARVADPDTVALYCLVDDHLHLVAGCPRPRAGQLARGWLRALRAASSTTVEPARIRPVETRSHLRWLLRYVLTQAPHHGLPEHPALWSGSCFQDLVGARHIDGFRLCAARVLPRLRLREVLGIVGLPPAPIEPATDDEVRAAGAARLASAGAAALCVDPELAGRPAPVVQARRAIVQLGARARIPTSELAWALRVSQRTAQRLASPAVPDDALRAIAVRLHLERRVLGL